MDFMDFLKPDLSMTRRHFPNQCAYLYDGYVFPSAYNRSGGVGPLAGYTLESFTVPVPGWNDYYIWKDTDSLLPFEGENAAQHDAVSADPQRAGRPVHIWCGDLYLMSRKMFHNAAAKSVLIGMPQSVAAFTGLMFRPTFFGILMPGIPPYVFKTIPFLKYGTFCSEFDSGHMIMKFRYIRMEFLFLQCFDTETWGWTWAVLLLTSLIFSFIGSKRQPEDLDLDQQFPYLRRLQPVVRTKFGIVLDWLRSCVEISLSLVGGILQQGIPSFDHYRRILVMVWLWACIVLAGCMQGSMRDLMSRALIPVEPDTWADLFRPPLDKLTIVTSAFFPYRPSFEEHHRHDMEEAIRQDRFLDLKLESNPYRMAEAFGQIIFSLMGDVESYIYLLFKRVLYMVFWMFVVYKPTFLHVLASLRDQSVGDPQVEDAYQLLYGKVTDNLYVSPGQGKHSFVFAYWPQAPRAVREYINRFLQLAVEGGFIDACLERKDSSLEKLWHANLGTHSTCTPIQMTDLIGPLIIFGCMAGLSLVVLIAEWIIFRADTLCRPSKIHMKSLIFKRHMK